MRLLIVDDEKPLAQSLKQLLSPEYAVDVVHDGQQGLFHGLTHDYDALILDLQLSDMSGLELCQELRHNQVTMPILILTAESAVESKALLLNAGADDYLVKPFSSTELKARLRALLRRQVAMHFPLLQISEFQLHSTARVILFQGKPLRLARKEFLILEYLLKHPNEVVSRYELLEHVWEESSQAFTSNTIDVHINILRNKIGKPYSYQLIKTVHGSGYMLTNSRYET